MIPATCGNCNAPLTGPYCAQCGQHAHDSARSLGALFHDAWHVITHVDSRFWSTLWLLLVRPGQLTLEYFAEHRARFVPPVRLYLVISIVFFGLASLTSRDSRVAFAGVGGSDPQRAAETAGIKREASEAALGARRALGGAAAPPAVPGAAAATAGRGAAGAAPGAARVPAAADGGDYSGGIVNWDAKNCGSVHSSVASLQEPLRRACQRLAADHGRAFARAFVANIPKMMFVFLPLIAIAMLLLYWFPRRYYVEHLVFVLHNHAALFLAMILLELLSLAARLLPALDPAVTAGGFAVAGYAVWYVYRATRRYYGQGRLLTLGKLSLVGLAYFTFLLVTLLGTVLVSVLTA